jgi:hypothetical protein
MKEQLIEVTKDEEVVQGIFDAAKSSMGQDITDMDKVFLKTNFHRICSKN